MYLEQDLLIVVMESIKDKNKIKEKKDEIQNPDHETFDSPEEVSHDDKN